MSSLRTSLGRAVTLSSAATPGAASRLRRSELAFLPAALEIVETPPSPTARVCVAVFGLMLTAIVVWSYFGRVDIITTAPGRVMASGLTKVVQPLETGVVRAIEIADGDKVKAGQVLILLDPTSNEAERDRAAHDLMLAELDESRLHAQFAGDLAAFRAPANADAGSIRTARGLMEAQAAGQVAKLADLDHQVAEKRAELEENQAEITRIDATAPMLQAHLGIRKDSLKYGSGNLIDYYDAMRDVVDQQQQRIIEQKKLTELGETVASLLRQRETQESAYRSDVLSDLEKAESQAAEKQQDLVKAAQLAQLQTIRAPVAGTVQQLAVHTVGGIVTPAQPLLSIVPDGAKLEIDAMIPNREVGFVQPGQSAEVKVEALEFTHYGLLHGKVVSLSLDAIAQDPLHQGPGSTGNSPVSSSAPQNGTASSDVPPDGDPNYMARIAVSENGLQTEHGFVALEPGMTVVAEIKTGRRRVIDYLLSPLQQYRHDTFRER